LSRVARGMTRDIPSYSPTRRGMSGKGMVGRRKGGSGSPKGLGGAVGRVAHAWRYGLASRRNRSNRGRDCRICICHVGQPKPITRFTTPHLLAKVQGANEPPIRSVLNGRACCRTALTRAVLASNLATALSSPRLSPASRRAEQPGVTSRRSLLPHTYLSPS
jgi:hypothetical protein